MTLAGTLADGYEYDAGLYCRDGVREWYIDDVLIQDAGDGVLLLRFATEDWEELDPYALEMEVHNADDGRWWHIDLQ